MLTANLDHNFINYLLLLFFMFVDIVWTKSLNPVPYRNMTPFSSLNIITALEVLDRL